MKYRKINSTGIEVSEVSLGCWTIGGKSWDNGRSTGYADVNKKDAIEALLFARELGVNHFDTADSYGFGNSERLLGGAFENINDVYISTKIGNNGGTSEHPYKSMHIRHQCEQSLENLKREFVDIYYFHHPYFGNNDMYLDEAVETMCKLKKEGKIRYIGLSAYSDGDFERLCPVIKPDIIQAEGNMAQARFIKKGGTAERVGLKAAVTSPLIMGILTGRYAAEKPPYFLNGDHRKEDPRFSKEFLVLTEKRLEKIKQRFGGSNEELTRTAISYVLSFDSVCCVMPGFRNKKQILTNVSASDMKLTAEDIEYIEKVFSEEI
ncbi:MAG: aldo/keto reductase [Candidatus Goldbacteria bacterium]|nr:aldo/keto reductase [Candidatus Goldiibacteriota bacterium]